MHTIVPYGTDSVLEQLAHRAWNPPPSSSLAEEEHLRSLLLRAAARDSRRSQLGDTPAMWRPVTPTGRVWVAKIDINDLAAGRQ